MHKASGPAGRGPAAALRRSAMNIASAVRLQLLLQPDADCSVHSDVAEKLEDERGDALFALAVLAWLRRQAPKSLEVRACMPCLLTTYQ